jgi:hypothetical protein
MAAWRDRRPLKRWRYVGGYGADVMLCAGQVRIAGIPQSFWAVWDRRELRERTAFRPGRVAVEPQLRFADVDLAIEPAGDAFEVVSAHGASYIWTRKQPILLRGRVGERAVEVEGIVDESAGYHARVTGWSWSAGVGRTVDGRRVAWNLVAGVHDGPGCSERTVWVDGAAAEVGPLAFDGLDAIRFDSGETLRFAAESQRARHDRMVLLDSAYHQPFGTFAGSLPGGVALAEGYGVMERHDVRW